MRARADGFEHGFVVVEGGEHEDLGRGQGIGMISRVAATPPLSGMCRSISTTSGR
jgi:hypothetical protein